MVSFAFNQSRWIRRVKALRTSLITLSLVVSLSLPLAAQQNASDTIEKNTYINGELSKAVDINKAKAGDKVTIRLTDNIASQGKTYTNGKIIGHIKEVQQPTESNTQTTLVIVFDSIQLKGRPDAPIFGVITGISPPAPPVITRVSGVPSPGDPTIRAAGPMVDSYGRSVSPEPAARVEPMGPMNNRRTNPKVISVGPNYVTHETVITAGTKLRLANESRISLLLNGTDNPDSGK
jgi:hypothetical protein